MKIWSKISLFELDSEVLLLILILQLFIFSFVSENIQIAVYQQQIYWLLTSVKKDDLVSVLNSNILDILYKYHDWSENCQLSTEATTGNMKLLVIDLKLLSSSAPALLCSNLLIQHSKFQFRNKRSRADAKISVHHHHHHHHHPPITF